ncbi:tetraspanin-19-like isoform X2 [Phoenix dactylifera]|uniref:Tetraspanin-19-like isoform X2 n=1 Tax=Phoenix dactylifera TaxID=42345 RepID=A0A8B7C0X5_PHODC|nr:tetraspanin-19-like isoform X2 [Phoenix dactylifera]
MVYCPRCWLHHGIRVLNLVANFFGMGMIVYSLWLLKLWREGLVEEGASSSSLPRPWFIYAFLGLGIVACFNALIGHMVISMYLDGNSIKNILTFHLNACRLISITTMVAQVSVLVLDIVLWALGPPPRNHCGSPATPNLRCSFLVLRSDSPPALPASAPVFARRIQSSSSAAC